jgi:hypothetical protein
VLSSNTSEIADFFQQNQEFFTIDHPRVWCCRVITRQSKEMQKFLKDWVPSFRIKSMPSMLGGAREPKMKPGFVEPVLPKTPAVEPLQRPDLSRPALNPVKVLERVMGEGSQEIWEWPGEPEGGRGCCAPARSGFFSNPA